MTSDNLSRKSSIIHLRELDSYRNDNSLTLKELAKELFSKYMQENESFMINEINKGIDIQINNSQLKTFTENDIPLLIVILSLNFIHESKDGREKDENIYYVETMNKIIIKNKFKIEKTEEEKNIERSNDIVSKVINYINTSLIKIDLHT